MSVGNAAVLLTLRSPLHRLLSGSMVAVRYEGRRSGREFTTPAQYARNGDDMLILAGRPDTKTWWRNFREDRDLEVLMRGRWMPMTARAVIGADEPDTIAPLLDAYLARFPGAGRAFDADASGSRARSAVIVWCRPR